MLSFILQIELNNNLFVIFFKKRRNKISFVELVIC
jgi:hypothetical protein